MSKKKPYNFSKTGIQYIDDVGRQLEKIFENSNRGSFASRRRYFKACERFVKEIVPHFKLKKLANIQDKHLEYYANLKLEEGSSSRYIKTDLAAIRYMHYVTPNTRHELMDAEEFNKYLELPATGEGRADRAWTNEEIQGMVNIAREKGKNEVADIIEFTLLSGCRLDEVSTLRRHHLENALREGYLTLSNTKGGRVRKIPVGDELETKIKELLPTVKRGDYVFVSEDMKVHIFKKQVQDFIVSNRALVQSEDRKKTGHNLTKEDKGALTFHGLRHTYARNFYRDMRNRGYTDKATRQVLTEVLGHGRIEVTYVYVPRTDA